MKLFKSILVAVDNRLEEHPALQWAVRIAMQNQARLKIVDFVPEFSWVARLAMPDSEQTKQVLADEKLRNLEALAEPLRQQGLDVTTKILFGKTSVKIMQEVLSSHHDLVLRVTKGTQSHRTEFFGTTSMRLLRTCPCAVWLVRADVVPSFANVLAAVDPAPDDAMKEMMNKTIMDLGQSIAEYENGQLHVVHAWEVLGTSADESWSIPGKVEEAVEKARLEVAAALDNFLSPYNLNHLSDGVHLLHDENNLGKAISDLAKQQKIDLIVMGTIARTGIPGALLGNTAEQVIDRVQCSVLTMKPNNFTSPMTLSEQ